jgi:hypothetical protein
VDTDDCGFPDLRFRGILVIYDDLLLCKTSRIYVVTSGVYDIVNDIVGIGVVIVACYDTFLDRPRKFNTNSPSWWSRGLLPPHHWGHNFKSLPNIPSIFFFSNLGGGGNADLSPKEF